MARYDRLHARPPAHDPERWTAGRVLEVESEPGAVAVGVRADETGETTVLRVSEAVYDLFVGRVDPADRAEGEVCPGAPVWFRARQDRSP